ncbi:MAG: hypothetical protein A2826_02470 [Candidatus Doudnabacteria bacterium RIFCSPHIGHO2_01_FULL_43_23]|uniref:CopG family transcriptional regulator n=1 Tax=Candidatus Doudnabacteria bacterium RIFCSPHIGHO2_01_FULL_43_23 TaxID=1817822 RepID=A0A1F5NTH6_9BACT|nr:MAG: hypothetical protein A2826_02470 [Candidatus Doudnabacteria bacterium RIFCSPHIGHO2_01_FULL_43_23]
MEKTIKIPAGLYATLEARAKLKGYPSTEDYINAILKQVAAKLGGGEDGKSYTADEEEQIKNRLKKLGYLG